jgi:putative ABC transport system permease protein
VQFLTEAVVIAVIGGVAGVALGEGLIPLLGRVMPDEIPGKPILVISSVWLGIGFSVLVGLLAGMIPALRAVRLDPLDALRRD